MSAPVTVDIAVAADTSLQESSPTANFGSDATLKADRDAPSGSRQSNNALLRFDLASIPANATVQSVKLSVHVTNVTSGEGYFLYPLRRAWDASQATWTQALGGTSWSAAGARGTEDRGTAALGTVLPTASGRHEVTLNAAGISAVQGWVTTPASNFGFVIDANTNQDGVEFESSRATNRPQLSVTYALPAAARSNSSSGLKAEYFSGRDFNSSVLQRTDATVDFDWGSGSPGDGVPADRFSVRWTGEVLAPSSGTYTFFTQSDDGVRLWVNGQQLINNWTDHAPREDSGTVTLSAGQRYVIKLEFYENGGGAVSKLLWASPGQAKQVIPSSQLFPSEQQARPPSPAPAPTGKLSLAEREALALGSYIPGVNTTGLLPGWTPAMLTAVYPSGTSNYISITHPGPYENMLFWGEIRMQSPTPPVFRNCAFAGKDPATYTTLTGVIKNYGTGYYQFEIYDSVIDPGLWRDTSVVRPGNAPITDLAAWRRGLAWSHGLHGGRATMVRVEIKNVQDGIGWVQGKNDANDNSFTRLEGCWIHQNVYYHGSDWTSTPDGTHSDSF
ncbi:MAG TPA: PA14 domain-containing protein, partial [Myxococcaceae bacterium]|nr:PA14 domain-containing protein [Myxococcaceae bacterium]